MEAAMEIIWPDAYKPENTVVHVRNELLMPGVELERVWMLLCRPALWPTWYPNSSNLHIKNQPNPTYASIPSFAGRPSA
jgi:hypothetical protein